jgi:glycosyltransferase involved in cell wall biosynthesis
MLIGLNGQRLLIDSPAGPEKYTYHIYNSLAGIDNKNEYIIYFSETPNKEYFQQLVNNNPNFTYKVIDSKISWTQKALSRQLFKDKPDIFFTPVHTLPILRPSKTKYISMVHGLEFKHIVLKNPVSKFLLGKPERYVCRNSDFLIVPSQGIRDEILKKQWLSKEEIEVIHEGVDNRFYKRPEEEISLIRKKYKINNCRYYIFVGTINPRKNLPDTIKAFAAAFKHFPEEKIILTIVGKLGRNYEESLDAPKKYGIDDNVFYLGRVPDEDLPALISGSVALVNFSLEEGFGLPLLEAMACATKCLISDIPSFREICGDYAIYADPKKLYEMEKGFIDACNSSDQDLIIKAKNLSKNFSWEESARKTLNIFERVVKNF